MKEVKVPYKNFSVRKIERLPSDNTKYFTVHIMKKTSFLRLIPIRNKRFSEEINNNNNTSAQSICL